MVKEDVFKAECLGDCKNFYELETEEVIRELASENSLLSQVFEILDEKDLELTGRLVINSIECPKCDGDTIEVRHITRD